MDDVGRLREFFGEISSKCFTGGFTRSFYGTIIILPGNGTSPIFSALMFQVPSGYVKIAIENGH